MGMSQYERFCQLGFQVLFDFQMTREEKSLHRHGVTSVSTEQSDDKNFQ